MRVKCRSCGHKFDYEGCGGMCPKCSSYYQIDYRPEEDMFGEQFEYDSDGQEEFSYEELQDSSSNLYEQYEEKRSTIQGKKSNTYTWCIVILMIIVMALPSLSAWLADMVKERRNKGEINRVEVVEEDTMQIATLTLGEAFPYETVDNYNYEGKEERIPYNIRITGVKVDEELQEQMPEGYEMLAVSYEITPEEAQEENSREEEGNNRVYSIYTNTYLLTKGGQYLYPLETYQMEELLDCEQEELEKRRIDSEFSYSEGLFYFMVKQGDAVGLRVFCQKYDYENFQMAGISAGYEIVGLGGGNDE